MGGADGASSRGASIGIRVWDDYNRRMITRYTLAPPALLNLVSAMMLLFAFGPAAAQQIDLPGGFQLGGSLDEAKKHAASRGWQLVVLSPELPDTWLAKDQNIGIHVCNNIVASITETSPGSLDDFAQIVFDLQMERGKPKLQVMSFMAGSTRISNIDARFAEVEGLSIAVQFSSTGGRLAISTVYSSDICAQHPTGR